MWLSRMSAQWSRNVGWRVRCMVMCEYQDPIFACLGFMKVSKFSAISCKPAVWASASLWTCICKRQIFFLWGTVMRARPHYLSLLFPLLSRWGSAREKTRDSDEWTRGGPWNICQESERSRKVLSVGPNCQNSSRRHEGKQEYCPPPLVFYRLYAKFTL